MEEKKAPKCKDTPQCFWYPKDSFPMEVEVYRWVEHVDRVTADDFLSLYDLDKRRGKDTSRNVNKDTYYGVSTFEDYEDALNLPKKVPAKKRHLKAISIGSTKVQDGIVRRTPSCISGQSHLTWWLFATATPETYFQIVDGENENNE